MAKINLGQMANETFKSTMQVLLGQPLPVRTAFKIKTLVNQFNAELTKFSELRKELLDRFCKKDEQGGPLLDDKGMYQFEPEQLPAVSQAINDLAAIEVEVTPIKLAELGDIQLTAQQLFDLGSILEE
jgi:hypothetical protein